MTLDFIVNFFAKGGGFMYPILLALIAGFAIIIERAIYIMVKCRIDSVAFVNRILEFIQRDNLKSAIEFCGMSQAPIARIMRVGLIEATKPNGDLQGAFEAATLVEIPKLEKRTPYLSTISNISTLLGLLGTIFGLIASFEAVSVADAATKATLLSAGISQAMNTTAFGLIAAIPCMVGYAVLQEKVNELIDEINQQVSVVYKRLAIARSH